MNTDLTTETVDRPELPPQADLRSALMSLPPEQMALAQNEYVERRQTFRDWLMSQLVEGLHYGFPPGCEPKVNDQGMIGIWDKKKSKMIWYPQSQWKPKASLYKAGADFIVDLMCLVPIYSDAPEVWEMFGKLPGYVCVKCRLYPKGQQRTEETLLGESYGCRKSTGDYADPNNAIKMAQKSAKVGAVLEAFSLSDLFTQDIEDQDAEPEKPQPQKDRNAPQVGTREQGDSHPNADRLKKLIGRWKTLIEGRNETPTDEGYRSWANLVAFVPAEDARNSDKWTEEAFALAEANLENEVPY